MRQARVKVQQDAYYHVTSRCALQTFLLGPEEKDMFVKMMRRAESFSGVEIVTYCVMSNHFHILVKVPGRRMVSEEELKDRITVLYGETKANRTFARWNAFREANMNSVVEEEQSAFRRRMYDISEFTKTLKQRYSVWYCANHQKEDGGKIEGTIWQGRFHSVLVEATQKALTAVAAYIDLNPVRAKIVKDAKVYRWSGYGAAKRGESKAKHARTLIDDTFYGEILKEKQDGFSAKMASVSRGVAIGTRNFVKQTIVSSSGGQRINTVPIPLARVGKLSLVCTAMRRSILA